MQFPCSLQNIEFSPGRAVKRNHKRDSARHLERVEQSLQYVIGLDWTARITDHGVPDCDRQSIPRYFGSSMQPVGFPSIAGIPPCAAQVPTATTAQAFGTIPSSHSRVVMGCSAAGSLSYPAQYPASSFRSFGIVSSRTRMKGARSPFNA